MTTLISAVISGVAVLLAGSLPWGLVLAPLNLRAGSTVPWAVLPMAVYLWLYWRFAGGRLGADDSAAWRREQLRANAVPANVWPIALAAGLVGFAMLVMFVIVMGRVMTIPTSPPITTPAGMPHSTMFVLLAMSSVVAGVTEEAGLRGYMQTPIERRYGLAPAIVVNGVLFGLLHFPNHPAQTLAMLPYYVAVAAVYSGVTWAADSILPAIVLHVGGDVWSLTRLWMTGRPEWEIGVELPTSAAVLAVLTLTATTWWLCLLTRRARGVQALCAW